MRKHLTLFTFASASLLHAQQCDWLTSAPIDYDSNPSMPSEVMASAPERLVVGRNTSGAFLYGQTLYGNAIMEALDMNGSTIWTCVLNDSVNLRSAAVAADGRAFFAGSFMGDLQVCDGSVLSGVPGQGMWNENLFLIAVDLNTGLVEWTRNLSSTHDQGLSIPSLALDPQGRLWYAVSEWGLGKAVRVDENGADVETRLVEGVRTLGTISFDPWGGLYMSGGCENGNFAFGGEMFNNGGTTGYSMFVLRFRPDGTAGFAQFADDITFQEPTVVATADGHAYLAGGIFDATQWGDLELHGPNWSEEVFLTRLDSLGEFDWVVESAPIAPTPISGNLSRSKGPCIAVDPSGTLYLIGDARGTTDWGNGVTTGSSVLTDHVVAVVAFTADGSALWSSDSDVNTGWFEARTITASAETGSVHISAHIRDPFTFGSFTAGAVATQNAAFAELSGVNTTVIPSGTKDRLRAWPLPARSFLHLHAVGEIATASLFTATGDVLRTVQLLPGINTIDISGLSVGVYFLRTAEGQVVQVVKE